MLVTGRINRARRFGPVESVALVIRSGRGRARLDRDRSDLVATVAHELRSPLTGVKGFVGTLLSKWDRLNDEQKKLMLTTVHADSERLSRLITELLDVARIDTGRLPLYPRAGRHRDARGAVRRVGPRGDHAHHRVVVRRRRCRRSSPTPTSSPRSSPTSSTTRSATARAPCDVTSSRSPSPFPGALIRVDDEGEGIPEEIRARVFTKFWKHGVRGGTGLGMYIVNGLVRVHGGEVLIADSDERRRPPRDPLALRRPPLTREIRIVPSRTDPRSAARRGSERSWTIRLDANPLAGGAAHFLDWPAHASSDARPDARRQPCRAPTPSTTRSR